MKGQQIASCAEIDSGGVGKVRQVPPLCFIQSLGTPRLHFGPGTHWTTDRMPISASTDFTSRLMLATGIYAVGA